MVFAGKRPENFLRQAGVRELKNTLQVTGGKTIYFFRLLLLRAIKKQHNNYRQCFDVKKSFFIVGNLFNFHKDFSLCLCFLFAFDWGTQRKRRKK